MDCENNAKEAHCAHFHLKSLLAHCEFAEILAANLPKEDVVVAVFLCVLSVYRYSSGEV